MRSQQLLEMLSESVDVVFKGANPAEEEVISKNLYAEGSSFVEGDFPYFWLLQGQQDTVGPLAQALGLDRAANIPFSGAFMFEFITSGTDEKQFVSTKLYDKLGFIEEIELACTSETQPEGY